MEEEVGVAMALGFVAPPRESPWEGRGEKEATGSHDANYSIPLYIFS
jgi:hypothetical protein